jgi:hypothetical protein
VLILLVAREAGSNDCRDAFFHMAAAALQP